MTLSPPEPLLLSAFAVLVEAGAPSGPQQHGAWGEKSKNIETEQSQGCRRFIASHFLVI